MPDKATPKGRYVLREGWQPLAYIGPEPLPVDEFLTAAAEFAQANACTVEDVINNGPYELVEDYAPSAPAEALAE